MQQIIQLKPEDDIASIRAKIDTAELSHLVLVVPRGCTALDREHGMRMLRRAADDAAAEVALVVHDDDVRDRAEMFGVPAFNSLAQAQRTHWKMRALPPDGIQGTLNPPPPETVARDPAALVKRWWSAVTLLVIAGFVLCIFAALFVPTANVHIVPSSVALTMTTSVLLDASLSQVSSELRAIPTRRLFHEINSTAQLKTTTAKNLPDVRSSGTVVFTNLRSDETTIAPDTVVRTSAGVPILFTTVTTVTVPAGVNSRVEAPIVAVEPGLGGNVKELAINTVDGSLSLAVHVINLKPTVSGTLKATRVVTADDKKKLETLLLLQLKQQGTDLLQQDLLPGEFVAPDSISIDTDTETFDHAVDDPADALNLRISATAFGLAVDRADLELIAKTFLQKQLQPGYTLLPNGVQVDPLPGGKYNGVLLDMPYRAVGYTTPQIDTNKVAAAVQGKSIDDAKAYLSGAIQLAQPPDINVAPPGWFRMPTFAFRIAVFAEPPPVVKK